MKSNGRKFLVYGEGMLSSKTFHLQKGKVFWKVECPVLFYFCPDLIFHKMVKRPNHKAHKLAPPCMWAQQPPGVVALVWRGSKVCEAIARYHRKKKKKKESEAWFLCHVRPLEMGYSWNNRPRLPPQGWLIPQQPLGLLTPHY